MFGLKRMFAKRKFLLFVFIGLLTACAACKGNPPNVEEIIEPSLRVAPLTTPTLEAPTATAVPSAAIVNGEGIPLESFEREVERYLVAQKSLGNETPDLGDARKTVLSDLIDQVLLAQAAREAGTEISDADVQARLDRLAEEVDLEAWMASWGYSHDELTDNLRLQMLVADQRDRIADLVADPVEQIELQQIFAFTEAGAKRALAKLNAGTPFKEVAFEFSPETGGYLGWVPRGYLLIPIVEDVAFDLPTGEHSEIIESDIGFHIVLVIDREVRPLTADARINLTRQAIHAWLDDSRADSTIEILID